jgi:hypothetical protein
MLKKAFVVCALVVAGCGSGETSSTSQSLSTDFKDSVAVATAKDGLIEAKLMDVDQTTVLATLIWSEAKQNYTYVTPTGKTGVMTDAAHQAAGTPSLESISVDVHNAWKVIAEIDTGAETCYKRGYCYCCNGFCNC